MVTDWITAVSTASAAVVGAASFILSIHKKKSDIKRRKIRDFEELSRCMDWVGKTKTFFIELLKPSYSDFLTQNVIRNCIGYKVRGTIRVSTLEKVANNIKSELSETKRNQYIKFINELSEYIYLHEAFLSKLFDKKNYDVKFSEVKAELKQNTPKDIIYMLGLSEESELSEYIFAYIKELNNEWKNIKVILDEVKYQ